jgi:hypothetical protein
LLLAAHRSLSPNDSVRPRQNVRWNRYADLLRGLEIDHQLKLRRLFYRKIGGFRKRLPKAPAILDFRFWILDWDSISIQKIGSNICYSCIGPVIEKRPVRVRSTGRQSKIENVI